jgi:hypothetical protein
VYVVIRFWKLYTETGYTILIHGLIHILYYNRITIIYYTIIIMTGLSPCVGVHGRHLCICEVSSGLKKNLGSSFASPFCFMDSLPMIRFT